MEQVVSIGQKHVPCSRSRNIGFMTAEHSKMAGVLEARMKDEQHSVILLGGRLVRVRNPSKSITA